MRTRFACEKSFSLICASFLLKGHVCIQSLEETEPAAEALPDRAALLVEGAAAGQVFVSVGPHDDRVFDRAGGQLLLSLARRRAFFPGAKHCGISHRAWYALSERCPGGCGHGSCSGLCIDHGVRLIRSHLASARLAARRPPYRILVLRRI